MLNTSQFHFDSQTKILSAEASELPDFSINGGCVKVQSFDITLIFRLEKVIRDMSGEDIQGWEFLPVSAGNVLKLVIYND